MVKVPENAPAWKSIAEKDIRDFFSFSKNIEIQKLIEKTDRLYYYWDKIRAQPIAKKIDKKEVWAYIRWTQRPVPKRAAENVPFLSVTWRNLPG